MTIRVLIVDDSENMRRLFTTALSLEDGIEVVGQSPGAQEAVGAVTALQPDCLVLDWQMPGMTGPEAVPLLKGARADLKVVLFSNVYGPAAEQRAIDSGADAFVEKQADIRELADVVRALFART